MEEVELGATFTPEALVQSKRAVEISACRKTASILLSIKQFDVSKKASNCNIYHHNANDMNLSQITRSPFGKQVNSPQFISNFGVGLVDSYCFLRDGQVWNISASGGEAIQISNFPVDVQCYRVFINEFDQIWMLVCADVFANKSMEETLSFEKSQKSNGSSAMEFDSLMVRHW